MWAAVAGEAVSNAVAQAMPYAGVVAKFMWALSTGCDPPNELAKGGSAAEIGKNGRSALLEAYKWHAVASYQYGTEHNNLNACLVGMCAGLVVVLAVLLLVGKWVLQAQLQNIERGEGRKSRKNGRGLDWSEREFREWYLSQIRREEKAWGWSKDDTNAKQKGRQRKHRNGY